MMKNEQNPVNRATIDSGSEDGQKSMDKTCILIVEDEAVIAASLFQSLTSLGYTVPEPVATGDDAIRAVTSRVPDLVLMDIELSGRPNGIETADRIQSFGNIPVIYLTAFSDDSRLSEARHTKPCEYLVRPVQNSELHATIQMALYKNRIDQKLKETEEKFRDIFNNVNDGVEIHEMDERGLPGRFIEINEMTCKMYQYTREELLCISPLALSTGYHNPPLESLGKDLKTLGHARFETIHRRKDGTNFPVEINAHVAKILGKTVVVAVVRDLTDRKNEEFVSRQRKTRLDLALRSAEMGVWQWDIIKDTRCFDDKTCQLLGIKPASFTGLAEEFYVTVHPDDRETLKKALARSIECNILYDPTYRTVWPDGSIHFIAARGTLVKDAAGKPLQIIGVIWDISDKIETEESLRESEEQYRQFVEHSPDGIMLCSSGRIVYVNPSCVKILGAHSAKDIVGHSALDFIHPDYRGIVLERTLAMTKQNQSVNLLEEKFLRFDGTYIDVEVSAMPVMYQNKSSVLIAFRDVTSRKKADAIYNLTTQKLQMMNIMAWHDVYNKITALRGYVEMSKNTINNPKGMAFLQREEEILTSIHKHIENTKEYQDMGRLPFRWVNLAVVIQSAVISKEENGLDISLNVEGLELFCDPIIEKVFNHLISQSLLFRKEKTAVRVSYAKSASGIIILYEDDSKGIPPENKENIFIRDLGKLDGFSFFFIHDILELSGMSIRETGVFGKGARFEITVPKDKWRTLEKGD
jgi:PAS domain S-box-containing protein